MHPRARERQLAGLAGLLASGHRLGHILTKKLVGRKRTRDCTSFRVGVSCKANLQRSVCSPPRIWSQALFFRPKSPRSKPAFGEGRPHSATASVKRVKSDWSGASRSMPPPAGRTASPARRYYAARVNRPRRFALRAWFGANDSMEILSAFRQPNATQTGELEACPRPALQGSYGANVSMAIPFAFRQPNATQTGEVVACPSAIDAASPPKFSAPHEARLNALGFRFRGFATINRHAP
jgi:hypothetical protein